MTLISIDCEQLILGDAKERILKNHTLEQIAVSHGITKRTLNIWNPQKVSIRFKSEHPLLAQNRHSEFLIASVN